MANSYNLFKGIVNKATTHKKGLLIIGLLVLYGLIGLATYWPIYPGDPNRLPGCVCGDQVLTVWFLRWVPYSISHALNPFFTSRVNVPFGANLAQNTLMPFLGFITTPFTLLVSPVASLNLLAWLAFPASAGTMFYLLNRITKSRLAAFVGGLLYGFSPYMVGQASNHIMLSFIALPPLIALCTWKIIVEQKLKFWKVSLLLAIEATVQYLVEPEILAITAVILSLSIGTSGLLYRKAITKKHLWYSLKSFGLAAAVTLILLSYPVWFMLSGSQHFAGSNFPADNPFRSDLIGLIVPTANQRFVPSHFKQFATQTMGGDFQESGEYVGPVLLIIMIVSVIRWRRNKLLVTAAGVAFICWVLSLGPQLVIDGHTTSLVLPFDILLKLPLLKDILPTRFSFGEWFAIALLMALVVKELREVPFRLASGLLYSLLALATIITLFPRWPYTGSTVTVPALFTSIARTKLNGAVALVYPFPIFPTDQAMLWQAEAGLNFKLVGSYIQTRNPLTGESSEFPALLTPGTVQGWLTYNQGVHAPWPEPSSVSTADVTSYLQINHVTTVIVDPSAINATAVTKVFTNVLGQPEKIGGILLWTHT
jgi:hypothetical protein